MKRLNLFERTVNKTKRLINSNNRLIVARSGYIPFLTTESIKLFANRLWYLKRRSRRLSRKQTYQQKTLQRICR